jgi:hypothetical protein
MTIKNGELTDADEVMDNVFGLQLKNWSQVVFASRYEESLDKLRFQNGEDFDNFSDYTFTLTQFDEIDLTDNEFFPTIDSDTGLAGAWICADTIDLINDGSVDSNLWSTVGTLTETTNATFWDAYINVESGSDRFKLDGVNAPDLGTADTTVFFNYAISTGSIRLAGATAGEVDVTSAAGTFFMKCRFDVSATTMYWDKWTTAGVHSSGSVDYSGLTGDPVFWFTGGNLKLYWIAILNGATGEKDFVQDISTDGSTITDAILTLNEYKSSNPTSTYYMSADNGSNWEEVDLNQIHRFTNTGTNLQVKVVTDPNYSAGTDDYYFITEMSVAYNLGAE